MALILCIACANIANLQLARATARRREMSLRAALGAGRARLVRQLLTESVVLALIGGTVGVLVARWGISALVTMVPDGLPSFGEVGLDRRVLLFSLAITIGAGLVFGAVPARYGTRGQLADALQGRGADLLGGNRVRQLFVAVQLGLCIVLLVGAGLLARSFSRLQQVPVGFNPDHLVTAELRLPMTKYGNDTVVVAFGQQALERLRAIPGVRSAALVDAIPLSGNWGMSSYRVEGRATPDSLLPTAQMNAVSDGFFSTMEIPLVMGREFSPTDRLGAPMVAIVNRELARRTWPGESPLGKRITVTGPPEVEATVVGVAGNVKQLTLSQAPTSRSSTWPRPRTGGSSTAWRPAPRAIPTRWPRRCGRRSGRWTGTSRSGRSARWRRCSTATSRRAGSPPGSPPGSRCWPCCWR